MKEQQLSWVQHETRDFVQAPHLCAMALSLALPGACSRGSNEATPAQETKGAAPAGGEAPSPPGRLTITAATASSGPESAAFVFDHNLQKPWNSGGSAPAWDPTRSRTTHHDYEGAAIYRADSPRTDEPSNSGRPDARQPRFAWSIDGDTADAQWLELQVKGQVRYLRVVTLKSPSWVAWGEIEVYE